MPDELKFGLELKADYLLALQTLLTAGGDGFGGVLALRIDDHKDSYALGFGTSRTSLQEHIFSSTGKTVPAAPLTEQSYNIVVEKGRHHLFVDGGSSAYATTTQRSIGLSTMSSDDHNVTANGSALTLGSGQSIELRGKVGGSFWASAGIGFELQTRYAGKTPLALAGNTPPTGIPNGLVIALKPMLQLNGLGELIDGTSDGPHEKKLDGPGIADGVFGFFHGTAVRSVTAQVIANRNDAISNYFGPALLGNSPDTQSARFLKGGSFFLGASAEKENVATYLRAGEGTHILFLALQAGSAAIALGVDGGPSGQGAAVTDALVLGRMLFSMGNDTATPAQRNELELAILREKLQQTALYSELGSKIVFLIGMISAASTGVTTTPSDLNLARTLAGGATQASLSNSADPTDRGNIVSPREIKYGFVYSTSDKYSGWRGAYIAREDFRDSPWYLEQRLVSHGLSLINAENQLTGETMPYHDATLATEASSTIGIKKIMEKPNLELGIGIDSGMLFDDPASVVSFGASGSLEAYGDPGKGVRLKGGVIVYGHEHIPAKDFASGAEFGVMLTVGGSISAD